MNRFPRAGDCRLLFQYRQADFESSYQLEMLRTHPQVVLGREVFDNIYYVQPEEFLNHDDPRSRLLVHISNIIERKHAAMEIQAARDLSEAIVETVREPLVVLDRDLRVISANRSFYHTFEVDASETVGELIYDLGNRQWDIPELRKLLEDILPRDTSFEGFEVERDFERIGRRSMLLNARRIQGSGDRAEMILLAIEDITSRKRAETRVSGVNRLFLSLGADFLTNMEFVIESCRNLMEADLAAYAKLEGGRLHFLTTAPGEGGLLHCDCPTAFAGWPLLCAETTGRIVRSWGKEHGLTEDPLAERFGFQSFIAFPVLLLEKPVGALYAYARESLGTGKDDLETMAALARALEIEEERLAREKGLKDFIDIASHELRHPITIIKGYALTMKERLKELPEEHQREMLSAIDDSASRLARLVESLLDTSRIERGRFQLVLENVEMLPLLRQAIEEMRAPEGRITLKPIGDLGSCILDRDRFLEVIAILLDNALKFSPPGSVVEIEAEHAAQGGFTISIMDRGEGIPPDERERVFNRFHQVETARFHSKAGMGMGLFIAREIVERHGGSIWYELRPGGGSIFRFTLPG